MNRQTPPIDQRVITIEGARQHNLKDISLEIPREKLVVVCGPSGSGKTTLAFDLIYAEGQRRYVESLSAYARQFLPQMDKPQVDKIEGLSPAISLEQGKLARNPRSTVGTVTEIYDFLRVFFARLGKPYCPECGKAIESGSLDEIITSILSLGEGSKIMLLAPLVERQKGTQADRLNKLKTQGFVRVRIDGEIMLLDPLPELEKNRRHTLELVVDRLVLKDGIRPRLADSLELALKHGEGQVIVVLPDEAEESRERIFSTSRICNDCKISVPAPSPQLFSFNNPQGACPACGGIGIIEYFEPSLLAPNRGLSLDQGAIIPWKSEKALARYLGPLQKLLAAFAPPESLNFSTPLKDFPEKAEEALFYGYTPTRWLGVTKILEKGERFGSIWHDELARFRQTKDCPACKGARLKPEALSVKVEDFSIQDFCELPVELALNRLNEIKFTGTSTLIAEPLLKELRHRLSFLVEVGLDYISLSRTMSTLSGGEAQRIRLAGQLGSGLVGVTYVLDEPSIGLHPRDNERLLGALRSLQGRGNTVLVVEHDEATIKSADHIVEMGPGSGLKGGEVVFQGEVKGLLQANTLTGRYFRGDLTLEKRHERREAKGQLHVIGARTHNLQNISPYFPLGCLTCVTGVSGSGKSSLVVDTLYKHLALHFGFKVEFPGEISGIEGLEGVEKIVAIDQSPIGRTPRSNPATYTKVFDEIRNIFSLTPEARKRGFSPGRFSFNVPGGRCETCNGDGQIRVEMHFLPDIYVTCEVCGGRRYNRGTLEVTYRDLNIADVLDLSVAEAREVFQSYPGLDRRLGVLEEVGLEYLRLGQPATTLSGGEAQRIKISRELGKRSLPGTVYILDEPTTGLHMHEVGKLVAVLHKLVDKGATVIVIEHNTDVIMASDYVIDLGPGGGNSGGRIIASGTPEEITADPNSVTGRFLPGGNG